MLFLQLLLNFKLFQNKTKGFKPKFLDGDFTFCYDFFLKRKGENIKKKKTRKAF